MLTVLKGGAMAMNLCLGDTQGRANQPHLEGSAKTKAFPSLKLLTMGIG